MFLKPPPEVIGAGAVAPTPLINRTHAALIFFALVAPFALYFGTVRSIITVWNSSETFAHGYVILPISLWLIWRRRENFSLYPPQPWAPGLALLALLGAGWFAAQLGEVQVVSQYTFVAMFPAIALTLFGPRLAGSLAFPLLFLLFAVPFGEVFVAPLIQFTADFTVAAVRATGIPVLRSGTRFELPSGNWSVVEACSGIRYLISSITLGSLYAYLTYRSTLKRAMFVGLSVVVPIVANGLRAYMIVMIGHLSGMALATGVDHLIYGWLFFGLVMFIMFWIGSYWREDAPAAAGAAAAPLGKMAPAPVAGHGAGKRIPAMAACVLAVSALWAALALNAERANHNPAPVELGELAIGWPQVGAFADWKPNYMEPDVALRRSYLRDTTPVGLTLLYYRNQDRSKSLISSLNRLAGYKDSWHETEGTQRVEDVGGHPLAVRETVLRSGGKALLVWSWMRIGGQDTTSNVAGKFYQAGSKLLLRGDDGAALMLSAPFEERPETARATLHSFLVENYKNIDSALNHARQH